MSFVPRIESNTVNTVGGPQQATPPPVPAQTPAIAPAAPAEYDGSPPLAAWTWSWVKTGGSLVDLADALRKAQDLRAGPGLSADAHAGVDAHRALALISA